MKKCKDCKQPFEPVTLIQPRCFACTFKRAKTFTEKNRKIKAKYQKAELKEKVKTLSDYKKELQYHINMIVRKIDFWQPCISSGRPYKETDQAGHFYPTSTQDSIRFNLWNIHGQSVADNMYKSGNNQGYNKGLREVYGDEIYYLVIDLPTIYRDLKLCKYDIIEATKIAAKINKGLQKEVRTTEQRIQLRKQFNLEIGIYL